MNDHAADKYIPKPSGTARQKQKKPMHRNANNTKRRKTGLAKRIEDAREKLNISQSEAAQRWGINVRTLQDWELGRRTPRGFALTQLEKLLGSALGPGRAKRIGRGQSA